MRMDRMSHPFHFLRREIGKKPTEQSHRLLRTQPRSLPALRMVLRQGDHIVKIGRRQQDQLIRHTTLFPVDKLRRLPYPLKMPEVMRTIRLIPMLADISSKPFFQVT